MSPADRPQVQRERRNPSMVRVVVLVSLLCTVVGGVLTAAAQRLSSDFIERRDAMLTSHETRIQVIERAEARRDAKYEAQYAEILRRLDNIEAAVQQPRRK